MCFAVSGSSGLAYYHKVKLNEEKWRIDAGSYLAKIKHLELQEKI